jgi:hypothetical protein
MLLHHSSPKKSQDEETQTPNPLKEDALRLSPKALDETKTTNEEPILSKNSTSISHLESKMVFRYLGDLPFVSKKVFGEDFLYRLSGLKGPHPTILIPLSDLNHPKKARFENAFSLIACLSSPTTSGMWYIDSASSSHMTRVQE